MLWYTQNPTLFLSKSVNFLGEGPLDTTPKSPVKVSVWQFDNDIVLDPPSHHQQLKFEIYKS